MEIRNLRSFKTIVEEGSFLKAAKKLYYTQSTITSHIKLLEVEFQVKLFEKLGRKMHLTPFGRELIPHVDKLLAIVGDIRELSEDKETIKGHLKIAMGESFTSYEFQDVLIKFKEKAPKVKLSILTLDIVQVRDRLESGQVDIGFLYKDNYNRNNLVDVLFKEIKLSLVGPKNNTNISFSDSNQYVDISFIINENKSPYRERFLEYLDIKEIDINGIIEIWSIEGIKKAVTNGLGITYLPDFVMNEELDRGELVKIDMDKSNDIIEGIYSYHKNKYITPAMKLFMDLVDEKYSTTLEVKSSPLK